MQMTPVKGRKLDGTKFLIKDFSPQVDLMIEKNCLKIGKPKQQS